MLLKNDELIAADLAKEVGLIVLASDKTVKFQNYKKGVRNQKVCETPNVTASNAIFEINKLKAQLQEKDDTIRRLHAEKDILGLLNVGSTESSFETKALETKIAQLKEGLTSLKIQND
nr:hypothetical protein [Tanacetum cinerariifolium]